MKKYRLILLVAVSILQAYVLKGSFLLPGNYKIYYGNLAMQDSVMWIDLNLAEDLTAGNITDCLGSFYDSVAVVSNKPVISFEAAVDTVADCRLIYRTVLPTWCEISQDYEENIQQFDFDTTDGGGHSKFTISLNKKISLPLWITSYNQGINLETVFAHEVGHSFGAADHNQDSDALMYYTTDIGGCTTQIPRMPQPDDVNAFKAVYEKPLVTITNQPQMIDSLHQVVVNDTIRFEIQAPELLPIGSSAPDSLELDCFLIRYSSNGNPYPMSTDFSDTNESGCYPLTLVKLDGGKYGFTLPAIRVKTKCELRAYVKRAGLTEYGQYKLFQSPYGEVSFTVVPCVKVIPDGSKSQFYSLENVNVFDAFCTDAFWNDYPYMDEVEEPMKFYYKEADSEGGYTEIPADEPPVKRKDMTAYSCTWESGTLKGDYIVKATAFYKEHGSS